MLLTLAAAVIVVPLTPGVSLFFSRTPAPAWMLLGSTVIHPAYGVALTASLAVAGETRAAVHEPERAHRAA